MSLMARVEHARSRLQEANNSLSGARESYGSGYPYAGLGELNRLTEKLLEPFGDVGNGFKERVKEELSGVVDTITNPIQTVKDAASGVKEAVKEAIDDPIGAAKETIKENINDFVKPYVDDWKAGRQGESFGRGFAEAVLLASPTKIFKGLRALGGDSDDEAPEPPEAPSKPPDPPSGDSDGPEPPGDPPSGDSDGPGDEPPGDPPSAGSDGPDDDNDSGQPDNWPGDGDSILTSERRVHILDGDGTGGGHGPGRGVPGKSEFPSRWSDEQTIEHIEDVAKDPDSTYRRQDGGPRDEFYDRNGNPVIWVVEGVRDGVKIRVITKPAGEGIITAFPPDIPRNP